MIKIVVIGVSGRMGRAIIECIEDTQGVAIAGGTEYIGHSSIGRDLGELAGIGKKELSEKDIIERNQGAFGWLDFFIVQS